MSIGFFSENKTMQPGKHDDNSRRPGKKRRWMYRELNAFYNIVSIVLILWLYLISEPVNELGFAALILAVCVFVTPVLTGGNIILSVNFKERRPVLNLSLFLPSVAMLVCTMYKPLANSSDMAEWAASIAVAALIWLLYCAGAERKKIPMIIVLTVSAALFGICASAYINLSFNYKPDRIIKTTVQKKIYQEVGHRPKQIAARFVLDIDSRIIPSPEIAVTRAEDRRYKTGDTITVYIFNGNLGARYFEIK